MTTVAETRPFTVTAEAPKPATSSFRPDIQGLRALAVAAVVLDHAGFGAFSGGYVGVDVFFVISGFLITQLLLREAQGSGSISLVGFYSRRARRILPAATVVLVATVLGSVALLGYVQAASVVTDAKWATVFAANVEFGREGTNYFSADDPPSPLQHFWSLSVEEQFYLVWPLLLLLLVIAIRVGVRRRRSPAKPTAQGRNEPRPLPALRILAVLGILFGCSLLWCVALTDRNPTAAYFSTPARAWELALGAICAVCAASARRMPAWWRAGIGWVGLVAVLWSVVHYTARTPFPGTAALVPVVGTALVIAGGGSDPADRGPTLILKRVIFQRAGDWSYSIYLWHWPLLIVGAAYLQRSLTFSERVGLVLASVALSALTYRFVETPFRTRRRLWSRPRPTLLLYPAAVTVTLGACLLAQGEIRQEISEAAKAPPITIHELSMHRPVVHVVKDRPDPAVLLVRASVKAAERNAAVPGQLSPPLLDLADDIADVGHCDYQQKIRVLCPRGDVGSGRSIVVFGDSHARSWVPAVERIAQREHFAAYYLVKPGCNAAQTAPEFGHGIYDDCLDWRRWAMQEITTLHPDVLLVADDLPPGIITSDGQEITKPAPLAEAFRLGLDTSLAELRPYVGRIVVMGDAPGLVDPPAVCLSERGANLGDCAYPRSRRSILLFRATRAAASDGGYQFVNPLPWFCADGLCPAVVGSTVTYRDREHISTEYALDLVRPLEADLRLSMTE